MNSTAVWRCVFVPAILLGGAVIAAPPHPPHLTDAQRAEIRDKLQENIRRLDALDPSPRPTGAPPSLEWPLRLGPGLTEFGYHVIQRFVDQDPGPGHFDHHCGDRTYDGHLGTDFIAWPYPFYKMTFDHVEVVAAAPGRIVLKQDGSLDVCDSDQGWNAVYIQHSDDSLAYYGHLKRGSTTSKSVGQFVEQGEYLGTIGISGTSNYPHLHLEIYDSQGGLIDPYAGPCNDLNTESWWALQSEYYDSAIIDIMTGTLPDDTPPCPAPENLYEQTHFDFAESIYFSVSYRDVLDTQESQFTIYRPDDSVVYSWSYTPPMYYPAHGPTWEQSFSSGPAGTYRFEAVFEGQTYERLFNIGVPPAAGSVSNLTLAKDRGLDIQLRWGASCLFSDLDFSVYEGSFGDFASHLPLFCSTGGLTKKTLTPSSTDTYYLVVPNNNEREGSYGTDGDGLERPPSDAPCLSQLTGGCP